MPTDPSRTQQFLMKDLTTHGADAALRRPFRAAYTPKDIIAGYSILDDAYDKETGAPDLNRIVWYALAEMLLNVGDICHQAVTVKVIDSEQDPLTWEFSYQLDDGQTEDPFMVLRFASQSSVEELVPHGFGTKAMGGIEKGEYIAKLSAYPTSVHPQLSQRSTSALSFMLIKRLNAAASFEVVECWHPENTGKHFARYHLTDGLDHAILDYYGPRLVKALAEIDRLSGRTEEDGRLINDLPSETEASESEVTGEDLPQ